MESIECVHEGALARVTLNRPQRRNAMSSAMWARLLEDFRRLRSERAVRGVIIHGNGAGFCAGADIEEFEGLRQDTARAEAYHAQVDACVRAIMDVGKPTVAAIHGACVGGGCSIAMACDFRVVAADARFAIPAARMGVVYSLTDTANLLALVGATEARRMLYTAATRTAPEACARGLVSEICDGDPLDAARALLEPMTAGAPRTIAGAKALINGLCDPRAAALEQRARSLAAEALASADHSEAILAFHERRQPRFDGS